MPQMQVSTAITPGDMSAALAFMDKRVRRHGDALDGISAALFSVMLTAGECLHDCGLPLSEVQNLFDQFKDQVSSSLAARKTDC